MDAILIFLVFGVALTVVYVQHYYDASTANILICLSAVVVAIAFACFLFYPYSELPSMQAKATHATQCFAAILGGVFAMGITAYVAARN
jgi:uncharacterized membrane protein YoaK (UPF0700 family)